MQHKIETKIRRQREKEKKTGEEENTLKNLQLTSSAI